MYPGSEPTTHSCRSGIKRTPDRRSSSHEVSTWTQHFFWAPLLIWRGGSPAAFQPRLLASLHRGSHLRPLMRRVAGRQGGGRISQAGRLGRAALLISGERDPVTPAQVADLVARGLSHSRHVIVPDGAHGFDGMKGAECIDGVIMDFIAAGSAESVDVSCVKAIERPAFLRETPVEKVLELPAAKLRPYAGTYVLADAGLTVDVTFENDGLRAVLPGQPPFLLEAVWETRFRFAGLPHGYFIEFRVQEGAVTGASMEAGADSAYQLKRRPAR